MAAIRFRAFLDAAPALAELHALGLKLVCVSNWDVSLPEVLARLRLACHFATIVTAASVGAAKPDARPFLVALERLGAEAGECVHVGDDPVTDIAGARAAGLRALLLDRSGRAPGSLPGLAALAARLDGAA
jgi:HAD superfamily hydrolase (TIGR01549 family)